MPLTISNNSATAAASHYLGKNQQALHLSNKKLASGSRLIGNADPGTLSVAMRLNASVTRLVGAKNNVQNGMSFVEVQDGMLDTAGRIVGRMAELKGMATQDPMKSAQDIASYDNEFTDLQIQLYQLSQQTFNGASLFANYTAASSSTQTVFRGGGQLDNTISIFTSSNGSAGTKISIHRSSLLSALTIDNRLTTNSTGGFASAYSTGDNSVVDASTGDPNAQADITFASATSATALGLADISMGVFEQALSNVAFLRAQG